MPASPTELVAILRAHPLVLSLRIIHYDETPGGRAELKVRCRLRGGYQLQVWLHSEPTFTDYAYQLFGREPLLRWDSAPHYPRISNAPHHFHGESGEVGPSPLVGVPVRDLPRVLAAIAAWLTERLEP